MPQDYRKYLSKIRTAESSGDDYATNPHGAAGRYQFLPSTWTNMGYNIKDIYNPKLQEEAVNKFTNWNANYLKKRLGIEPTDADLYGAHFLGAAGYSQLYQTPNNAPISTVMSPREISSNPFVKGKTVGYVKNWLAKKMNQPGVEYDDTESSEPVYNPITPEQQAALDAYVAQATAMTQEKIAKENYKSELAKQELEQKEKEQNFLNELNATFRNAQDKQEMAQAQPQGDGSEYNLAQVQRPTLQTLPTPMLEYQKGGKKGKTRFSKLDLRELPRTVARDNTMVKPNLEREVKNTQAEIKKGNYIVKQRGNYAVTANNKVLVAVNRKGQQKDYVPYKTLKPGEKLSQDDINKIDKYKKALDTEDLGLLRRPLTYLESPEKILGDVGIPGMETSEDDRLYFAQRDNHPNNANMSTLDKMGDSFKYGLKKTPGAALNLGLAILGNPEGSALRVTGEAMNPLPMPLPGRGMKPKPGEDTARFFKQVDNVEDTSDLIKPKVNPFTQAVKSNLDLLSRNINNQKSLAKELLFNKNTKLNRTSFLDSKNKIYQDVEEGYKTLDSALDKKIKDLNTEEGKKRLVNQEKEYLEQYYSGDRFITKEEIEKTAKENAEKRIEELENIKVFGNKNKNFVNEVSKNRVSKLGINKPDIEGILHNRQIPNKNAFYDYNEAADMNRSGTKMLPGEITIGRAFKDSEQTAFHEINHGLQRNRTLVIDDELRQIKPDFKDNLTRDQIEDYLYFTKGSDGQEPSSFLAELRSQMQKDKFIENTYDEVTPELIEKAKSFYASNPEKKVVLTKTGLRGLTDTRILDFARPTKENYKLISDSMNKLPAVVPVGLGVGAAASQIEEEEQSTPEFRNGGFMENNTNHLIQDMNSGKLYFKKRQK
jgi:hypothetical protein